MHPLLKQVLRDHAVTENQFAKQNSPIVQSARRDFIVRATTQYGWTVAAIAKELHLPETHVQHLLETAIRQPQASSSCAPATGAPLLAIPPLGEEIGAPPLKVMWSMPDGYDPFNPDAGAPTASAPEAAAPSPDAYTHAAANLFDGGEACL